MNFGKMKARIGVKLALGFGVVIGLATVIVAVALLRLATLDEGIYEITDKGLPRFELMHAIVNQADALTRDSRGILLAPDVLRRAREIAKIDPGRKRMGELLEKLEESLSATGRRGDAIREPLQAAISGYLVAMVKFTRAIEAENFDLAHEHLATELDPRLATLIEVLQRYQTQESAQLNALGAHAHDIYYGGKRILSILVASAALIAAAFVWGLARSIGAPLHNVVWIANSIANGKLDNAISRNGGDEAGEMLAALDMMQNNLRTSIFKLEQRNNESAQLTEMSNLLQTASDEHEAAEILSRMMARLLAPHAGAIYLTASSINRLDCLTAWGDAQPDSVIGLDDCWGVRRARSYCADDPQKDVFCAHVHTDVARRPYMCVPMMAQSTSLGMLHVQFVASGAEGSDVAAEDRLRVQRLADQVAMALANLKLRQSLREQSIRDALTGMYNRRYLEETLVREHARAERETTPLAVFMIDVDHFKRYNDQRGHGGGDAVLRALGRKLRETLRASDIAARYGGEEFTVLLHNTPMAGARQWGERLCEVVRQMEVKSEGRVLPPITISLGLAMYPEHGATGAMLLQAADRALYEAKHSGRDRLAVATRVGGANAGATAYGVVVALPQMA